MVTVWTEIPFPTKALLKEAVAVGKTVAVFGEGGVRVADGEYVAEGPPCAYPAQSAAVWYARVDVKNSAIVAVLK
jgi:hypothetical protein